MCKKSLLFVLLMALLAPWAANAQTTVEIGDGTSAGYYTPIGTYYTYSITEQLYTADEIGTAGTITSISFNYAYTAAKEFPITVYMANVDATDLSTGISLADADEVFDGTLSVTGAGWVTIDLDTPFAFDGTSNLLIGVNKGYCQWFSGSTWTYTSVANMARYTQNDSNAYDLTTVPGTITNNRPNIQIAITAGSGPVCEKPATMEASNVTTNSATLTWTGGSGTYNVEYMGGTVTEWTSYLTNTTATSANLTGLTPGTNYQYRVQSVCTDGVSGWKSVSFSTMFGIPLVEGFGTAIPSGWSIYSGLVETVLAGGDLTTASYGWSFGSNNGVFDNHARINIYGTGCNYWLVLPTLAMEDNVQLMFDVAYTAYSGTGAPALTGEDDKFVVLVNNGRTWEIVRQWDNAGSEYVLNDLNTTPITVAIDLSNYAEAGQPITVAFYGESTVSNADNNLHIDNVSIDYIPACAKPTGLAVNYEGGTEATVSWTSDATAWNMRVNGTEINGTITNPYTLTGLELATTYEVEVQANCGDATSDWVGPVSFKTDNCMPEDMCALTFVLSDSYGDGWNGASIDIYDYTGEEVGDVLATVTLSTGTSETQTLNFCNGQELAIVWVEGGYDDECSYTITDLNGDVVAQDDMELAIAYTINCTVTDCRTPSDFVASEIGPRSVKLSWTENGPATEWVIAYMSENDEEITEITVNTNPYTLTGLTPETMYAAQVTPVCEVDKPSEIVYWTTDVACPRPTNLSVTAYPTSADVTWNGIADAYGLEWALLPATESKDPYNDENWYYYDNGTYVGSVGLGGGEFHWGVMFPAGTYEGTLVSKVKAYDINAMVGTLAIYNDGETAPANQISIQDVEFTGAGDWVEFETYANIDPSKNVWIVFDAVDGAAYPIGTSADDNGDANGRWVEINGTWYDMASVGVTGRANMLRAYIEEGVGPEELDWNPVSGITSPYTIEGLQPETTYIVRVKALCGGEDGESVWTTVTFTTPSACATPINLAAEVKATSATLSWSDYQDSYNLKYRYALPADPTAPATIILEANDVWEDGSGYQMLLDADASAYGVLWNANHYILLDGEQYSGGDLPTEYYNEFEYKLPTEADGSLSTTNVVVTGSVTLQIPAGTYDYAIFNPTPGDRFYIAADAGEVGGAEDDFVFEPGVTYHFTMQKFGGNDGAALVIDRPMSDWTEVTVNDVPYTLTGLTPETYYEWQIQGVNASCESLDWTEIQNFTTREAVTQTITLTAGTNWVSSYVEITKEDLQNALVAALTNPAGTVIKSQNGNSTYRGGRWRDQSFTWDVAKMYKIVVPEDCEITLTGMPINPAEHPITIAPNAPTWIGFPFAESMTPAQAIPAGFAVNADIIKGKDGNARYGNGNWRAQGLNSLEPGKGYMYVSGASATEERTLVYPSASKAAKASPKNDQFAKVAKKESLKTLDISFIAPKATMPDIKVENKSNTALKNAFNKLFNK